jgi:hypothetical protein
MWLRWKIKRNKSKLPPILSGPFDRKIKYTYQSSWEGNIKLGGSVVNCTFVDREILDHEIFSGSRKKDAETSLDQYLGRFIEYLEKAA